MNFTNRETIEESKKYHQDDEDYSPDQNIKEITILMKKILND